jgi:hypothetical protein
MKNKYAFRNLQFALFASLSLLVASCKKDKSSDVAATPSIATPTKLGLIEADSSIYKILLIDVTKIGTQTVDNDLVFDTGSGGMVIDADGLLPASMITSSGFNFTGDSTVVNGITITSQKSTVEYGDDAATLDKVYGNLAYASVTIGETNGNIVVKRLPFFIYYKAVDSNGKKYDAHEFDVMGVSPQYDITFPNNAYITSPFSYFDPGNGLTKGFKIAALGTSSFSYDGTYVPGVVTLGLTSSDLSTSSGFTQTQLTYDAQDGYSPIIPGTVTYNSKSVSTYLIFDTGTEPYSYIEDPTSANRAATLLPQNTALTVATSSGYNYAYTTSASDNLTYIENTATSGTDVSIISLEYFLNNEYMVDFADHKLGLKNN